MSLINQMLQDLDSRRAADQDRQGLHKEVRPVTAAVPRRGPGGLLAWGGGALLVGAGAAAAWLVLAPSAPQAPAPVPVPAAAAAPVAAPVAATPPSAPVAVAPEPESEPALQLAPVLAPANPSSPRQPAPTPPAPPAQPAASSPASAEKKAPAGKGATSVSVAKSEDAAKTASSAPGGGESVSRPAKAEPSPAANVPAAPKGAPQMASGPEKIEKNLRLATPRDRAEQEYRLAVQSLNSGRVTEAQERLRAALRQDPTHANARQLLVRLLLEQRAGDEARQVLAEGLEANPGQVTWAVALARLQAERGEVATALATLQKSAPAGQDYADFQGLYGNLLARQSRHKDAAEHYLAAARLNPGEGRWWLGLALALEADGRGGDAKEAFARARAAGNLPPELAAMAEQRSR